MFGVVWGQWLEAHDTRPCGPRLEQVGPCRRQNQDRYLERSGVCHEEVEQGRLRPVQVFDAEDERPLCRERRDEVAERPGDVLRSHRPAQSDERGDSGGDLLVDKSAHLRARVLGGVFVVDRSSLADDLGARPEGDSLPVREATPVQNASAGAQSQLDLGDKARLADPRLANDGQEPAATLGARLFERCFQPADLLFAADERGRGRARGRPRCDAAEAESGSGSPFPFASTGTSRSASTASPASR